MSFSDLYRAVEGRSRINAERMTQRSQEAAKSAAEEKEANAVESRLLDFFPNGFRSPPASASSPFQSPPPPPLFSSHAMPPAPKLLSNLHGRTPSVSHFTHMGLGYPEESSQEQKEDEASDAVDAAQPEPSSSSPNLPSSATLQKEKAALLHSRQRTRVPSSHNRTASSLQRVEKAASAATLPDASSDAVIDAMSPRSRLVINQVQQLNRKLAAPPPPPPSAVSPAPPAPLSPRSPLAEEAAAASSAALKKRSGPASAFLQQLAGLIKTPQQAAAATLPLHRQLITKPEADAPKGYVPAPFVKPARPASPAAARAHAQRSAAESLGDAKSETQTLPPAQRQPAVAEAAEAKTPTPPTVEQQSQEETPKAEETKAAEAASSEEEDDSSSSASSSPPSPPAVLSDDGSDDALSRSMSSLWSAGKRRQDRLLRPQHDAAVERRNHRETLGKSLVTAGVIVQQEGTRLPREQRRLLRRGKRVDGEGRVKKLTLEERKAVKMAAVYRQQRPAPPPEEHREQEEAAVKGKGSSPSSPSQTQPIPAPRSPRASSPAPRQAAAFSASAPIEAAPVPPFLAAPLPPRPPTDIVFGRTTALTEEEEKARRVKRGKGHSTAPSLFDLAYGTTAPPPTAPPTTAPAPRPRKHRPPSPDDDENVPSSGLPLTLPTRALASPGLSSHRVLDGVAKGLPMSLVTIARRPTSAPSSTALVPPSATSPPPLQPIGRQKARTTTTQVAIPALPSSLSSLSSTFPKAARTLHPAMGAATPAAAPAKRFRLAPRTKARLERLHAEHRETQAWLAGERAAKEAEALMGCTFTPVLAPKTERLAAKKRLEDAQLIAQWELIKARAAQQRAQQHSVSATSDAAPESDEKTEESGADLASAAYADAGSATPDREGRKSRAHVMHDAYALLLERKTAQKAMEDAMKAEQEISECTFDPFARSRRPSTSHTPPPSSSPPSHTHPSDRPPLRSRVGSVSGPVPKRSGFSVHRMVSSYEEQFRQARLRQQRAEAQEDDLDAHSCSDAVELDRAGGQEEERGDGVLEEASRSMDAAYAAFAWTVPSFSTHTDVDDDAVPGGGSDEEFMPDAEELALTRELMLAQLWLPAQSTAPPTSTEETPTSAPPAGDEDEAAAESEVMNAVQSGDVEREMSHSSKAAAVQQRRASMALLSVDIAMADGRVERMHLHDGDDLLEAAGAFVALHGLQPAYTAIIEGMLTARLQEALTATGAQHAEAAQVTSS